MANSGDPRPGEKGPNIANGPGIDDMLQKAGLPETVAKTGGAEPLIIGERQNDSSDGPASKRADSSQETRKSAKIVSALNLLEKLSTKPNDEVLKKSIEEQLKDIELTPFERAIAQQMEVQGGLLDRSQFVLEAFTSKKLLTYAIRSVPPLLDLGALVGMTADPKFKSQHAAVSKTLKAAQESNASEIDVAVVATLRSLLVGENEKSVAKWIEKTVLPLSITLSAEDGGELLTALYVRIEPDKAASSGLKELLVEAITWITQPQNLPKLDDIISHAAGMGGGSFATVLRETKKMPLEVGSPRYHLVMSLLKPRERKTITFLSQSGILRDFSIEALGLLAQNENSYSLISSNESALSAVKDECRRRLKSEELPLIHYWLLKFPNVRHWLTDSLILQRLRPQDDYLSQIVFDEGRISGEHQAQERGAVEVESLKNEIEVLSASETRLVAELSGLEGRYKELEERLRNVANSANSSRDDQIRQAQIDSIKVLIEFMNAVEISNSRDDGTISMLDATRGKLKNFGVAWRYEVGSVVPFVAADHLASGLTDGAKVQVLTPCYYMANTPSQIALVKARVLPQ